MRLPRKKNAKKERQMGKKCKTHLTFFVCKFSFCKKCNQQIVLLLNHLVQGVGLCKRCKFAHSPPAFWIPLLIDKMDIKKLCADFDAGFPRTHFLEEVKSFWQLPISVAELRGGGRWRDRAAQAHLCGFPPFLHRDSPGGAVV